MADDDLSINFSINPELSLQELLRQGAIIEEVLGTAAKFAATRVDREFAGLGQAQLSDLRKRAETAFETVRDQSGKTAKQIRADVQNFNALFAQLTKAIANVGELGFDLMAAASKKANKELSADSKARTAELKAEADEARKTRLRNADVLAAVDKTIGVESVKIRAQAERNADSVITAAKKATAQAAGRILVEQEKEDIKERLRLGEAAAAKAKQLALEEAKTQGKIQRDALNDQRDAAKRVIAEELADKRQGLVEKNRLDTSATQAFRDQVRDRQAADRRSHIDALEATRSANRLELAEEKGHQFRRSEAVKSAWALTVNTVRNFRIRHREDQRHSNRLEVIEDERKSAESIAVKQSELRQIESLSRASLARQAASQQAQTVASRGVTGAALGRSNIGIGLRNLAFAGGGILSARSTFTIGADFVGSLRVAQAQLKLTDAEMQRVRDTSIELGKAVDLPGVSAKDAADAMLQLAKSGLSLDATLGAARGTLELARATGSDFAEAAFQVGAALNVFDIAAGDATKVADILAKTVAVAGGTSFDDLSLAVRQAGAVFALNQKQVVGSNNAYAELTATIAVLAKNGLRGQDAGTSLKQLILSLTSPSAAAATQLGVLAKNVGVASIAYDDATHAARPFTEQVRLLSKAVKGLSQEQRDAILGDIFGSDAVRAAAILSESAEDLDATYKSILESQRTATTKGFAQLLAEARNKGLKGAIDVLKSQIETFQILLFEKIERPIQIAVLAIAKGLDTLANSKSFAAIRAGLKIVAIAAAGLLIAKVAGEAVQFLALSLRILAFSPFALISVGVLGAAFALGFFASKNKEFGVELAKLTGKLALLGPLLLKDLVRGDITAAKDHLVEILQLIGHFPLIELVGETIKNAGQLIVTTAVNLGKAVVASIGEGIALAKDLGPVILGRIEDAVRSAATSAVAIGRTILEKLGEGIEFAQDNQLGQKIGAAILGGLSEAGRFIANVLTDEITIKVIVGVAAGLAAGAIVIVGAFVKGLVEGIIANRGEIASALSDIFVLAVGIALLGLKEAFTKSPIWAQILLFLGGLFVGAKIFGGLSTAFKGASVNIRSGLAVLNGDFVKSRAIVSSYQTELRKTRVGELDALGSKMPSIARSIRTGLIDPFNTARTTIGRAATSLKTFEQNFLTLGRRGSKDLQGPIQALGQLSLPLTGGPTTSTRSSQNAPLVATQPLGAQQPQGQLQLFPTGQLDANLAAQTKKNFDIATRATQVMIDEQTKADRIARGLGTAMLVAAAGASAYTAAVSTGAVKTLSLLSAVGSVVLSFAQGGPIAGAFALAAAGVGLALGQNAKKAAEAAAGVKRYIEVLKEETTTARRLKLISDFQTLFEDNDKAATAFVEKLGGNFGTLTDAIFESRDAAIAYKEQLLDIATAEALAGRGSFAKDAILNFKTMTDNGVSAAEATAEVRRQIETTAGFDFIDRQIEGYATALTKQDLLKKAIGNSKDEQARLTKLAELDRDARIEALETQKKFLGLVSSNEAGVINLALNIEDFSKQQKAFLSAPADEQPRLRLELEKTARTIADEFVANIDDAVEAGAKIGLTPIEAVNLYRAALQDKLINGLKLSQEEAKTLLEEVDKFANKRVKTTIELEVELQTEEAKKKAAALFAIIGTGGANIVGGQGQIIDFGGGGAASGAIIRREQIIKVGEGNKPEVIIPLTDPVRAMQLASASGLLDILSQGGDVLNGALFAAAAGQTLKAEVTVKGSGFGPGDTFNPRQTEDRRGQAPGNSDLEALKSTIARSREHPGVILDEFQRFLEKFPGTQTIIDEVVNQLIKKNVGFGVGTAAAALETGLQFETDPRARIEEQLIGSKIPKFGKGDKPGPTMAEINGRTEAEQRAHERAMAFPDLGINIGKAGAFAGAFGTSSAQAADELSSAIGDLSLIEAPPGLDPEQLFQAKQNVELLKTAIGTDLANAIETARIRAALFGGDTTDSVDRLEEGIQKGLIDKFGFAEDAAANLVTEMDKIARDILVQVHFNDTASPFIQSIFEALPSGDLGIDIGATVTAQIPQGSQAPVEVPAPADVPVVISPEIGPFEDSGVFLDGMLDFLHDQGVQAGLDLAQTISDQLQHGIVARLPAPDDLVMGLAELQAFTSDLGAGVDFGPTATFHDFQSQLEATRTFLATDLLNAIQAVTEQAVRLGTDPQAAIVELQAEIEGRLVGQFGLARDAAAALVAEVSKISQDIVVQVGVSVDRSQLDQLFESLQHAGVDLGVDISGTLAALVPHAARGRIIDHEQLVLVGERGRREVIIPLEDPDRAFALMVATGLDKLVAGPDRPVTVAAPAPGRDGPLIGELHVNEVAGDPVATGIIAGRHIAARIQGALV